MSKPIKDKKEISQVGTISANNDRTIGDIISEAMEKVGKEGVITVEENKGMETALELVRRLDIPLEEIKLVFVNGAAASLDTVLADGDRVGIFPPVGGG